MSRFNRLFVETFDEPGSFVVLFLKTPGPRARRLRYAGAGHGGAYVRRAGGIEQLPPTGPVIGLERDERYATGETTLVPGETLLLATDGLTESRDADGEFLGDDGVIRMLASAPEDPQAICDMFVAEVERRSDGAIHDDLRVPLRRAPALLVMCDHGRRARRRATSPPRWKRALRDKMRCRPDDRHRCEGGCPSASK